MEPGEYQILIELEGHRSDQKTKMEVTFLIHSPYWRTWWFNGLSILAISSIIAWLAWGIIKMNKTRLLKDLSLKNEVKKLKLRALQQQLDPHFIFNYIGLIQSRYALNDPTKSESLLNSLVLHLRKLFQISDQEKISLSEEIIFLQSYMELMKEQFNLPLEFEVNKEKVTSNGNEVFIPPMILQPVLENTIKHGIDKSSNNVFVNLKIIERENYFNF